MKLSMSMISEELPWETAGRGSGKMRYERWELLCPGAELRSDVLYLADPARLAGGIRAPKGCGIVCAGQAVCPAGAEMLSVPGCGELIDLVNAVGAVFHKYSRLELQLHQYVNLRHNMHDMLKMVEPYFGGNELWILTPDFRVRDQSGEELNTFRVSGLSQPEEGILPQEAVTYLKTERHMNQSRGEQEAFMLEPGFFACHIIGFNIYQDDELSCRMMLSGDKRPFRKHDAQLLAFVAEFVQSIYDALGADLNGRPVGRLAEIMQVLIRGEKVDLYRLSEQLHRRGWDRYDSFVCMCIQVDALAMLNRSQPYYCSLLNREWDNVCAFEYEGKIVCAVDLERYGGQAEEFFAENMEKFRDLCFNIGYSEVFHDIIDLFPNYRQSEIALRIGSKRAPQMWRYRFSDQAMDYILDRLTGELDAKHLASYKLRLLIDHDRVNKTEYCRTLQVYINSGLNAMQSARELYIHRTTMMYRLGRIKELTGLDFSDGRETLYIRLSLVLLKDEIENI